MGDDRQKTRGGLWAAAIFSFVASLVACGVPAPSPPTITAPVPAEDPLSRLGLRTTTGAAPGYVRDSGCALCHAALYDSYQGVGMAKSMMRPRAANLIEDLDTVYVHEPSRRSYAMTWSGETLLFRRWQTGEDGERIHELELPVEWIVGSGYRSRVYLYRTPGGELYQLPIAWYTQENAWAMAPGFDREDHAGVERPIRRECLFCHNAYPEVSEGSDAAWAPQTFPEDLPEGTGCQRCHGPGAQHISAALSGAEPDAIRAAIVNPAHLPRARRDSVCFQCHLLPAVEMPGVRRFDRTDYSFRPGELLSEYIVHVDIEQSGRAREDRFEINHHAYRLTQSPCYIEGRITCTDCHDPHQPLRSDPRVAGVNGVCLRCHEEHDTSGSGISAAECATCHMPRRRTQDVVHVTMTDHRIPRRPPPDALTPLEEREPGVDGLTFFDDETAPAGVEGEIYRAVTTLRAVGGHSAAREYLEKALPGAALPSSVPWLDLISAELQQGRFAQAEQAIGFLPEALRAEPLVVGWSGIANVGLGRTAAALVDLRKAAAAAPDRAEPQFNLGLVLHRAGEHEEGAARLGRALDLRPNFVTAWIARSAALEALGRREEAIEHLRRALAFDPTRIRAYAAHARLLREAGRIEESERVLRRGVRLGDAPAETGGRDGDDPASPSHR